MWQRIQTLYLFIAIAFNAFLFVLNMGYALVDTVRYNMTLFGFENDVENDMIYDSIIGFILVILAILLSLFIIFSYKKRQRQIKLAQLNLLIQVGLVVYIFLMADTASLELVLGENFSIEYGVGAYLGTIPLLFIYLAIRAIKKDEALIRAADRIR